MSDSNHVASLWAVRRNICLAGIVARSRAGMDCNSNPNASVRWGLQLGLQASSSLLPSPPPPLSSSSSPPAPPFISPLPLFLRMKCGGVTQASRARNTGSTPSMLTWVHDSLQLRMTWRPLSALRFARWLPDTFHRCDSYSETSRDHALPRSQAPLNQCYDIWAARDMRAE